VERCQAKIHTDALRLPAGKRDLVKLISGLRRRPDRERSGLYFLDSLKMTSDAIDLRAPVEAIMVRSASIGLARETTESLVARDRENAGYPAKAWKSSGGVEPDRRGTRPKAPARPLPVASGRPARVR